MDEPNAHVPTSVAPMLEGILSNPALLQTIGSILGSAPADAKAPTAANNEGLAGIATDPALMAKLPQVMAMLQPMLQKASQTTDTAPADAAPDAGAVPTVGTPVTAGAPSDRREALLMALKPFLSPARCEAIDTILQLSRLSTVMKHLQ